MALCKEVKTVQQLTRLSLTHCAQSNLDKDWANTGIAWCRGVLKSYETKNAKFAEQIERCSEGSGPAREVTLVCSPFVLN